MSNPDDSTQPTPPSDLSNVPRSHDNGIINNVDQSIHTGTLPSTAIGGHTDTNKMASENPPPIGANIIISVFPFAQIPQELPEYHRPMMSQVDGTLFDDSVLFGDSVPPSIPVTSVTDPSPVKQIPPPSENGVANVPTVESAAEAVSVTKVENLISPPVLDASETESLVKIPNALVNAEDSGEKEAEVNESEKMAGVEEFSKNSVLDVIPEVEAAKEMVSEDMNERERDLAAIMAMSEAANAEIVKEVENEVSAPPKRMSRHRRTARASQALGYRYNDNDTLGNDSEDEEGGWNEEDEVHATQQLLAPKLSFGSDDEEDTSPDHIHEPMALDPPQLDDDEAQPEPKRSKTKEIASNALHSHQTPSNRDKADNDDEVKVIGSTASKQHVQVIDSDEEDENGAIPPSKPRSALGNVGIPSKPPSSATDSPNAKMNTSHRVSKNSGNSAKSTGKKANLVVVEDGDEIESNGDQSSSTPAGTSSGKSKSEKSAKKTSKKTSSSEANSKAATPSKSRNADVGDDEHVPVLMRAKRDREDQVKSPVKVAKKTSGSGAGARALRSKKVTEPGEALSKALRQNAKESIAAYLQKESEDMEEFFTQRSMGFDRLVQQDPPKNMLSHLSFIVTGLKLTDTAESAEFIKRHIRALGGKVVNFRPDRRKKLLHTKNSIKKRVENGEDPKVVELEEKMAKCILISDKPQRTLKYISALASGVPCVHYRWFLASYHYGRLLPLNEFLLPSGYNEDAALVLSPDWVCLEDQSDAPFNEVYPFIISYDDDEDSGTPTPRSTNDGMPKRKNPSKSDAGQGYRVEIIGTSEFKRQWTPILTKLGAMVVQRLDAARNYGRLDYILSDSEPTDLSIKLASARNLPLCTIDWAIQTIIQHKLQEPLSKPAYTLDLEE